MKKKSVKNDSAEDLRPEAGGGARKTQVRFKNLGDVRRFMARVLNDLDADIITEVKARTLGYLCSVLRCYQGLRFRGAGVASGKGN